MSVTRTDPAVNTTPAPGQDLELDVDVTEGCIKLGAPGACTECPVALALLRSLAACGIAVSEGAPVVVQMDCCTVRLADTRMYGGTLDTEVRAFILGFDSQNWRYVQPFRFRLHLEEIAPILSGRIERLIAASRTPEPAAPIAEGEGK